MFGNCNESVEKPSIRTLLFVNVSTDLFSNWLNMWVEYIFTDNKYCFADIAMPKKVKAHYYIHINTCLMHISYK